MTIIATGISHPYPDIIQQQLQHPSKLSAFVAHFYFRGEELNLTQKVTYFNIVREPVDRVISHYM